MNLLTAAPEPPSPPLTEPVRRERESDAVSLPCPFRTPTRVIEGLTALRAQGRGRDADKAFDEMRVGMRRAAQSRDISVADIADVALRGSPARDRGIDHASGLLALRGHPRAIGVKTRL